MSGPVRNTFSSSLFTHSHTIAQAITHYEQAADYYKGEDSTGLVIILWMVVQIPFPFSSVSAGQPTNVC